MSVASEALERCCAGPHFGAHVPLGGHDFLGRLQHTTEIRGRDDENPLKLAEDQIARIDGHTADLDRHLVSDHFPAPYRVERRYVAVEDLEIDRAQLLDITEVPLQHHPDAPAPSSRIAGQLAEMPDESVVVLVHDHRVGWKPLEDLEITANPLDALIPAHLRDTPGRERVGKADHPLLRKQRTKARRQHLLWKTQLVEGVADRGEIQTAKPAYHVTLLIQFWSSHFAADQFDHIPRPTLRSPRNDVNPALTQMTELEGQIAVVAGAGGAIGSEIARSLAAAGAQIGLLDVDAAGLAALERSSTMVVATVDLTSMADTRRAIEEVENALGGVTILVNCAGWFDVCEFDRITEEEWGRAIGVNLTTVFNTCVCLGSHMQGRGYGSIVNLASTAGETGSARPAAHYAAAKAGVVGFSKSLARELGASGVRVNVVSPGPIDTPMLGANTVTLKREFATRTLVGRLGSPTDVAAAVLFLADPASSFVTGEVLRVNGGSLL